MAPVTASIAFLARDPLYETERPFTNLASVDRTFDVKESSNLIFDNRKVTIADLDRDSKLDECGFQLLSHSDVPRLATPEDIDRYSAATEQLLQTFFGAEKVICYDVQLRENAQHSGDTMDLQDRFLRQAPARGAHSDYTFVSGPIAIKRKIAEEERAQRLQPGFRFRIVNTWRSILPVVEDCPLALLDTRTLEFEDLIEGDEVRPDTSGESFFVHYNERQQWYWKEHMTPEDLLLFLTYDSMAGDQARICVHSAFDNPKARPDAPPRQSVETRSIVISRLSI